LTKVVDFLSDYRHLPLFPMRRLFAFEVPQILECIPLIQRLRIGVVEILNHEDPVLSSNTEAQTSITGNGARPNNCAHNESSPYPQHHNKLGICEATCIVSAINRAPQDKTIFAGLRCDLDRQAAMQFLAVLKSFGNLAEEWSNNPSSQQQIV